MKQQVGWVPVRLSMAGCLCTLGVLALAAVLPVEAQTAMSVDGVVDVTSGGLGFPDGTVQRQSVGASVAPVGDTGQQTCYDPTGATSDTVPCSGTGQDGEKQAGADWPAPRFTDNQDGTVTDNLTELIWLQDAGCFAPKTFQEALGNVALTAQGLCSLNDGSAIGDWRLPNIRELLSLVDYSQVSPALPPANPFINVQSEFYWSSTTSALLATGVWGLRAAGGNDDTDFKTSFNRVWPVRGGE